MVSTVGRRSMCAAIEAGKWSVGQMIWRCGQDAGDVISLARPT